MRCDVYFTMIEVGFDYVRHGRAAGGVRVQVEGACRKRVHVESLGRWQSLQPGTFQVPSRYFIGFLPSSAMPDPTPLQHLKGFLRAAEFSVRYDHGFRLLEASLS